MRTGTEIVNLLKENITKNYKSNITKLDIFSPFLVLPINSFVLLNNFMVSGEYNSIFYFEH